MAEEKKKGAESPAVEAPAATPADQRSEVARERERRIAMHVAASDKWSKQFDGPTMDDKPTILVLVATPRGGPVKLRGRVFKSNEQSLVNQRELRMLTGLSRRGVCALVVGKIKTIGN